MPLPKPSSKIEWTVDNPAPGTVRVEPTAQEKKDGWDINQRPPREFMNFLFFNLDEWIKYLEQQTDLFVAGNIDAIVDAGGNGTHLTLQAAHDAAEVIPGSKIIIVSDLVLVATQSITKPDIEIEMSPGFRFTKGVGAPATNFTGVDINASAKRTRLSHLAFGSATPSERFAGGGDLALNVAAAADHVFLMNPIFVVGNTTDIVTNGNATMITAHPQIGLPQ